MKLEKREVTLNETDTLKDALIFEKTMLTEYAQAAPWIEGTERRAIYGDFVLQSLRDVFYLSDLLKEKLLSDEN